ncbi:MAG TPA: ribosome maturation factor RimP [Nitrospiria bacterium]|nr:ribosome maturation factor RimP [Nitrospiria bacterium]
MKESTNQNVVERVKALAHPILSSLGLDLVEVEQKGGRGRVLLRIYIDKAGGVTLKDCQEASIYLGHALDVEDPVPFAYTLEVSSPGLDRPLKRPGDYQRAIGKSVRIHLIRPIEGQGALVGRLVAAAEDRVTVEIESGQRYDIPLADIQQTRLEIEW